MVDKVITVFKTNTSLSGQWFKTLDGSYCFLVLQFHCPQHPALDIPSGELCI